MINNVVLVGRLTKDPDLRYTASGSAVATFTLAVNRNFTNQNGDREADFINCVIWRKPAETMANYARKGTLFATEQLGIEPDLLTSAKSLAGGYPISALIGRADIMDAAQTGGLGGTYSGSPLGCVAALAVMEVIEEENLLEKSTQIGQKIAQFLQDLNHPKIAHIRHMGAMLAFDLVDDAGKPDAQAATDLKTKAFEQGLLLASCGMYGNAIRIMVPLTVEDEILDEGLQIIANNL